MSTSGFSLEEVPVSLTIRDGKLTVESRSGAKSGAVELVVGESTAELVLRGPGTDRATAELTGPELSSFRTFVDAGLSALVVDRATLESDRRVLSSGFETLDVADGTVTTTLDPAALERLGLLEDGALPGGSRQVRCTVLSSGTVILNLLSEPGFEF